MKLTEALEHIDLDGPGLEDGEVIADIVILCRLMKADEKHSAHAIYTSSHTDAIVQYGIVRGAEAKLTAAMAADGED